AAALARTPRLAGQVPPEDLARLDGVLALVEAFRAAHPGVIDLRDRFVATATLLKNLEGNRENASLITAIRGASAGVIQRLRALHTALGGTAYPFDHAKQGLSLADYVVETVPTDADQVGEVF